MDINRLDIKILTTLAMNESNSEISGMTIDEINLYGTEQLASRCQMVRRISHLLDLGYIQKGIVDVRAYTYFITTSGLQAIKWIAN